MPKLDLFDWWGFLLGSCLTIMFVVFTAWFATWFWVAIKTNLGVCV